jgi:hypothetical protein
MSPSHTPDGREIDESLFADVSDKGASVQRMGAAEEATVLALHGRGHLVANSPNITRGANYQGRQRDYLGFVQLCTGEVRGIFRDDFPAAVRVYDTSRGPDDALHGDIICNSSLLTKIKRKAVRVALLQIARDGGLFAPLNYMGIYNLSECGFKVVRAGSLPTS